MTKRSDHLHSLNSPTNPFVLHLSIQQPPTHSPNTNVTNHPSIRKARYPQPRHPLVHSINLPNSLCGHPTTHQPISFTFTYPHTQVSFSTAVFPFTATHVSLTLMHSFTRQPFPCVETTRCRECSGGQNSPSSKNLPVQWRRQTSYNQLQKHVSRSLREKDTVVVRLDVDVTQPRTTWEESQ